MLGSGLKYLMCSLFPRGPGLLGCECLLALSSALLLLLVRASMRTEETLITVLSSGIMSHKPPYLATTFEELNLEIIVILFKYFCSSFYLLCCPRKKPTSAVIDNLINISDTITLLKLFNFRRFCTQNAGQNVSVLSQLRHKYVTFNLFSLQKPKSQ